MRVVVAGSARALRDDPAVTATYLGARPAAAPATGRLNASA